MTKHLPWCAHDVDLLRACLSNGLSHDQIAERLDRTIAAVSIQIRRRGLHKDHGGARSHPDGAWNRGHKGARSEKVMVAAGPPIHEPYKYITTRQNDAFHDLMAGRSYALDYPPPVEEVAA